MPTKEEWPDSTRNCSDATTDDEDMRAWEVTLSVPYTKSGDHPEAMLKVFLTIIEKTPSGGASMDDLKDAYEEVKGQKPCDKTIRRMIRRMNLAVDPLAYGAECDPEDTDVEDEELQAQPLPIEARRQGGVRRYVFTRDIPNTAPCLGPDLAFLMAISLYPQQRSVLPEQFQVMMTFVFENILRRLAEFSSLRKEMERYVHISGYGPADPRQRVKLVQDILHALRAKKRVQMVYRHSYDGSTVHREVEPYGLLCRHNVWYLVGRCRTSGERRVYRLDHIERMTILENTTYEIPRDFSLKEAYRSSWGVWTRDEKEDRQAAEKVRLRVAPGLAHKFRVTRYHESQVTRELPGGEVEVEFTVTGAQEMIPWLMMWGPHIRILAPDWLREQAVEGLRRTLDLYLGSQSSDAPYAAADQQREGGQQSPHPDAYISGIGVGYGEPSPS